MKENKTVVSACVEKSIYYAIQKIAKNLGISISEYVRRLIINDLDKRGLLNINVNLD